jgi:hypothetical protein
MARAHYMTGETMTVQTVKLAGKKFVIVAEKDYRDLKAKAALAANGATHGRSKTRRLTAQDRGDIAEARRRLADPNDKEIPYELVRKQLGLA